MSCEKRTSIYDEDDRSRAGQRRAGIARALSAGQANRYTRYAARCQEDNAACPLQADTCASAALAGRAEDIDGMNNAHVENGLNADLGGSPTEDAILGNDAAKCRIYEGRQ